ncbi:MAG TPA: patatin-like phospholipase family protein [Xanthobacteraceae bacterium]|jgi:NTE family protein
MVSGWYQRAVRAGRIIACAALAAGCSPVILNSPINQPITNAAAKVSDVDADRDVSTYYDDMVIGLTFSGGGTRAAAFSYGVLKGFDETHVTTKASTFSLLDHIDFVSAVSGGSVLAAYYGLKKRAAMADFEQRFLLANAEEGLQTRLNFLNIARGLEGGINDSTTFPKWLDDRLFNGATFRSLLFDRRPRVWINASDIYNRTPFVFGRATFGALCSDLSTYPISMAVGASAAVPVVFAPVVIQNYPGGCPVPLPKWVERVRNDANAAPLIKSYASALERYHSGEIKYVKLLDGGIVDNYGLAAITIERLAADTPYGPFEPEEAIKLRRLLFLVVDSGRAPSGQWAQTIPGPSGVDLITAASDTATEAGAVGSYSAFRDTMDAWQDALVRWRCHLSEAERKHFGAPPGWNCQDLKFFVGRIAFDQLGPERAAALNDVQTALRLPPDQVEMVVAAGRDALKASPIFRSFLDSLAHGPPHVAPLATQVSSSGEAEAR